MAAPEKRYDQDESSASSSEDFVNAASATPLPSSRPGSAASTARPSSRTTRTSVGSRSTRRAEVHSSSSGESTDSEEEAELRDELANVDVEAGTVRGAPVEGRVERVMRSITKGNAARQSYAAVDDGGSSRRTKSHRSSRSSRSSRSHGRSSRSYSLGATPAAAASAYADPLATEKLSKAQRKALAAVDPESAAPTKRKSRWWWILLVAIILIIIAVVVFFVVRNVTSDDSSDLLKANSTAAADSQNSTGSTAKSSSSASVSGSLLTDLPGLTDGKITTATTAATTATFDDGKYRPATTASVLTGVLSSASGTATGLLSGTPTAGQTGNAGHATDSSNVVPMPTGIAATQSGVQNPSQDHGDGTAHATGQTGAPTEWAPQKTEQPQQPSSSWWPAPQDQGQDQAQDHGQDQGQDHGHDHGQDYEQQQQHPGQQQAAPSQGGWQSPAAPNGSPSGFGTPPSSYSNPSSSSPQQQPGNGYYKQGQPPQQQPTWPQGPGAGYGGQGAGQPSWNGGQPYGQPQPSQQGDWQQPPAYGGQGQGQYQNGQGAYPYAAAAPIAAGPYIGSGNALPSSSDGSHADLGTNAGGWPSPGPGPDHQQVPLHPFANSTAYKAERPEQFQTYKGNGTWFESSLHIGGCGFATQETDFVVALSNQTWESSRESKQPNSPSKFCGAEVLVTNQQTGMSIKAWVTEHCAYCVGENALDLSKAVFEKLTADTGGLDQGIVPIIWGFTGNVSSAESPKIAGKGGQKKEGADEDKKDHDSKDQEGDESDKGWFDGWFGSSDESDHASE
ncbi:hypothetical protein RHOSPDRAFT_33321 [Rhodotorula sp. JG-1b]|nr:hypothetical protein RHOSPDRAFT_33321 [Rhodotorula sp. JG-1b]